MVILPVLEELLVVLVVELKIILTTRSHQRGFYELVQVRRLCSLGH